uniref:Uncharacterized protein n=1 Tax=Rhizophora mucronata TaxID=61149 RepID=A0A2P2P821_RHIMU
MQVLYSEPCLFNDAATFHLLLWWYHFSYVIFVLLLSLVSSCLFLNDKQVQFTISLYCEVVSQLMILFGPYLSWAYFSDVCFS